ncbi:MAG: DegQ family serine endoprotease [Simkaniaceae bacterium]|nr:MAG: DegQ family serine endoprotease [Simkaniaceae bacterium]
MKHLFTGIFITTSLALAPIFAKEIAPSDGDLAYGKRYPTHPDAPGKAFSKPFIDLAKSCTPAVVFIRAEGSSERGYDPNEMFNDEFFRHFFGGPRRAPGPQVSQGSGFIVSKDGHIMTNLHVVRGAKKLTVHLQDGSNRQVSATYVGGDPRTDIAIIKIDDAHGNNFPYLELGDSDGVEVGEWVVAIGNPFSLEASVSAGIISAKGRQGLQITDYEDFIQTDAAINPGNSGGPLIDLDKKVIGMNTAIVSQSGGYMGIGFAIPSNILINIKDQLVENGVVTRGFLGVSLQPIDPDLAEAFGSDSTQGALIVDVVDGSPAEKAGLKQGDIVVKMNGSPIKSPGQLRNDVVLLPPGTKVDLTVNRNGRMMNIPVTLGEFGANTLVSSKTASQHLGLTVDNLTNENLQQYRMSQDDKGVLVVNVEPGTPADTAGIKQGFLVMAVNHKKVHNVTDFNNALKDVKSGQKILLLVRQGDMMKFYTLKAK